MFMIRFGVYQNVIVDDEIIGAYILVLPSMKDAGSWYYISRQLLDFCPLAWFNGLKPTNQLDNMKGQTLMYYYVINLRTGLRARFKGDGQGMAYTWDDAYRLSQKLRAANIDSTIIRINEWNGSWNG